METQVEVLPPRPAVLVVEDDVMLSKLITKLLDEAGYRSLAIYDHEEIAAAIDRFDPSCVILDGEIGRTGRARSWADAAAIRRTHPALPVLMFTADEDALAEERAGTSRRSREAGFVGVVPKPFLVDDFLTTLRSAIAGPRPVNGEPGGTSADLSVRSVSDTTNTDFFNAAVHQLKTPLATISGQMQLARRVMAKDAGRARAAMAIALEQVDRMTRLIATLQNERRVVADAQSHGLPSFDLCEAVRDAISRNEQEETPRFRLDHPDGAVRVRGDPDHIAQILDNLLNNAVKYSPPGAAIDVTLTTIAGEAQVRVEDYGIGVAAEERDRMFTAYFRTVRARDIPGLGLGLHISRRLAEQNGGRLWLDDSTDAGSVFAMALPITN